MTPGGWISPGFFQVKSGEIHPPGKKPGENPGEIGWHDYTWISTRFFYIL